MSLVFRNTAPFLPSLRHHEGTGFVIGTMKLGPDRFSRRIIPEEDKALIREEYADGKLQKVLAKEHDVSQMTISNICKGTKRRKGRKTLGSGEKAAIRDAFANGTTLRALASLHDITPQGVSYICRGVKRKKGWRWKPGRRLDEDEKTMLREEFADGKTHAELADKYDVSRMSVRRICKGVARRIFPKQKREIGEQTRLSIKNEYADGKMQKVLAKEYDLSPASISNICKGVERRRGRKQRRTLKNEEKAIVRNEYSDGKSQRRLAKEHNVSPSQIANVCKGFERKTVPKERRRISEEVKGIIREEYANGSSQMKIAKRIGVSQSSVYNICKGVQRERIPKNARKPLRNIHEIL